MVGLIVDSGYERISKTVSVNSACKINKMALLFAKTKCEIAFSNRLITSIWKVFPGPTWWVPYNRHWILENV